MERTLHCWSSLSCDSCIHASLLIVNELIMDTIWSAEVIVMRQSCDDYGEL